MLYLHISSPEASPKAISRRTSYLRARLEFLRYPQVIPAFFNIRVVRSSTASYRRFNLPMDRSPGFGSTACNYLALLRLGFPAAPRLQSLNLATYHNSLARSTKSTWSDVLIVLPLLVGTRFQVLFHSPPGVLFTFPSRYFFTIGHQVVFRLGWWSTLLPTAISRVPWYSGYAPLGSDFAYGALTLFGGPSQTLRLSFP